MSPTKDGLDFEAIARGILKSLFENDKNLQLYMSTGRVDYCLNKLISNLKDAHAEGLKKSVVAKVPSEETIHYEMCGFINKKDKEGSMFCDQMGAGFKLGAEWMLKAVRQMNPELFGEIKK